MIQDEVSKYFNFMYEDFIRAISPVNGATDVSIDTSIEISVGVNLFQYILYIPSLLDDSATRDDSRQLIAKPSGNMLQYYNGNLEEASKHGFRQVCNQNSFTGFEIDECYITTSGWKTLIVQICLKCCFSKRQIIFTIHLLILFYHKKM
mmetsp:Transcript_8326/g.11429  ORF Transcript_8326/g.11429 Transcript_8326/m.11429 type:complete len:149 (-) Transcript_8326:234-680(-)